MTDKSPQVKFLLTNGVALQLDAAPGVIDEMTSHPKFIHMQEQGKDVYVSLDDIIAFELIDLPQEKNEETQENA